MTKREIVFRSYIVLLMASMAVDVNLFPVGVLSVQSLPLSIPVAFIGAAFPLYFFRDFLRFVRERRALLAIGLLFLLSGLVSVALSPFPGHYGLKLLFQYGAFLGVSFLLLFLFSLDRGLGAFFLRTAAGLALVLALVALFESANLAAEGVRTARRNTPRKITARASFAVFPLNRSNAAGTRRTIAAFREPERTMAVQRNRTAGRKTHVFIPELFFRWTRRRIPMDMKHPKMFE